MTKFGGISAEQLRQYIERIERLEQEKSQVAEHIREAFAEAKGNGYDPKIMRQVLKIRKMDHQEREEQDFVLDTYLAALGLIPAFEPREREVENELEAA